MNILGALTIAAALTAGFTACSNDDITTEQPAVQTYTVSIPASFDEGQTRAVSFDGTKTNSTFVSTEEIYVYNVTKDMVLSGHLQPTEISANGKGCKLTGSLSGSVSNGDELRLLYNPNDDVTADMFMDYTRQTGAAANVVDGAVATSTHIRVVGNQLTTTTSVAFENAQSIFHQRLIFKNAENETIHPTITKLRVRSKNNKLVSYYRPLRSSDPNVIDASGIGITNPTIDANGDIYLALRFTESSSTDALILTAYDSDGNVYELEKSAPSTGFQNGRYYHGTMTLPYARNMNSFMVTGTSATPNSYSMYDVEENNFDITVSGTTGDCIFYLNNSGKMTLNDVTATNDHTYFISGRSNKTLTLEINGTNTISCVNSFCIKTSSLKLCGTGTLTVSTTARPDLCGIAVNSSAANPNTVAAEGYTVTRTVVSSTSPYTWIYTVAPSNE